MGLFIAGLRVDYCSIRASKLEFTREKAKPRVIGGRKATGPVNTFSSGIAGLPEKVVKTGLLGSSGPVFLFLARESGDGFVIVFLGARFATASIQGGAYCWSIQPVKENQARLNGFIRSDVF